MTCGVFALELRFGDEVVAINGETIDVLTDDAAGSTGET